MFHGDKSKGFPQEEVPVDKKGKEKIADEVRNPYPMVEIFLKGLEISQRFLGITKGLIQVLLMFMVLGTTQSLWGLFEKILILNLFVILSIQTHGSWTHPH